jgi:RHH-type proline utilization regulon transcriptional repressor/proline dehydrogenase/delta 1-pyrroline-5-carboxylate dehydrogenase
MNPNLLAKGHTTTKSAATDSLQPQIEARGREIFARMKGAEPGIFKNIPSRLMDWSMRNETLKVQLFRFVDVLPTLRSSREIARHAQEYLGGVDGGLPAPVRWGVQVSPRLPWLVAFAARHGVAQMARTFILARNGAEAIPALLKMRRQPLAFTLDILGETAVSELEAAQYESRYLELIESLARATADWPPVEQIDSDDRGLIPRVNISVKLSALNSQIHPADPETAIQKISARLRPLLHAARQHGVFINLDMESHALKDVTFEVFQRLLDEPEFRDYPHFGVAFQAYLRAAESDFEQLLDWAKTRQRRITIRLIKGAYWDYETVMAGQRGWPSPVFAHKSETDANYEKLARRMLENPQFIQCAFGTHNVRSIAACMVQAERLGRSPRSFEFQMLHGMAGPVKQALTDMGYRVRDYCPVGEVLPGMSYLVRRLLENTSNEGFLRAAFNEHVPPAVLLRDPAEAAAAAPNGCAASAPSTLTEHARRIEPEGTMDHDQFKNEPLTDFTIADHRQRMQDALQSVRKQFGRKYPLVIGGREVQTEQELLSINPARPSEIVGRVAKGRRADADAALAAARAAARPWSRASVEERACLLERAADLMRRERFDLAALEVFETGKPWIEADADVAEAVDFCNFYAQEMRRIAAYHFAVPGETSLHHYVPRGLAVVIAPWNFRDRLAVDGYFSARRSAAGCRQFSARSRRRFGRVSRGASRREFDRLHRLAPGWPGHLRSRRPRPRRTKTFETRRLRNGRQKRAHH